MSNPAEQINIYNAVIYDSLKKDIKDENQTRVLWFDSIHPLLWKPFREKTVWCCHVWPAVSRGGFTEQCGTCQVEWMWYYTRTFNEIWEGEEEWLYNRIQATAECPQGQRRPVRGERIGGHSCSHCVSCGQITGCLILSLISFQILQLRACRDFWPLICRSPLTLNLRAKTNITT